MGERVVTAKGGERRPKNWVKTHRLSHISGMRLICKNNKRFLQRKLKWDYQTHPNPDFKWSNVIVIDTTQVNNKAWNKTCPRALAGNVPVKQQTQEKRLSGGSAFNGIWAGDSEVDPGIYSFLDLNYPKCKHVKKNPESSLCSFHGTPKCGPGRKCGMSGTADTHEYHLEKIVKQCLNQRGCPEIVDNDPHTNPFPDQPLAYVCVQMDKSTCQSYNHATNLFGYKGIPTKRTQLLLEEISGMHGVFIVALVQPTHCFDVNGCDALLHAAQKKKMRSYPAPLCTEHIVRDWGRAVEEACTKRLIQRCFVRALERNEDGDVDKSLIPKAILQWYDRSDNEEGSCSEGESE